MPVNRREFLTGVGGVGLAYAFHIGCGPEQQEVVVEVEPKPKEPPVRSPDDPEIDYRAWLVVGADGVVTAYTCRVEIGQGLETILTDVLSQGMELPPEKIHTVMGDTALCPADGPTTGSAATQYVAWGFWQACAWVRGDLLRRAAERLRVDRETLRYHQGEIVDEDGEVRLTIGELVDDTLRLVEVDPDLWPDSPPPYVDQRSLKIEGEAIVTGTRIYTGDLHPEGCLYGGKLRSPFHAKLSRTSSVDLAAAEAVPGVVAVRQIRRGRMVFADSYTAMRKGLKALDPVWVKPDRPEVLDNENEIRSGAQLVSVLEESGDAERAFARADEVVSETYITQYASQTPIETDTAVAEVEGDTAVVRAGTQNPLLMRFRIARQWNVPEENIRVIGMPVGGGFGAKAGHTGPTEAANMAREIGKPVKVIYSREEQFNARSRYKESVVVDIATALDAAGQVIGRTIDIHQDAGFGSEKAYAVPNVRTRLFEAPMPVFHGVMRGTSYVQVCYALESHIDSVARTLGEDPLRFRKANVLEPAFRPLLDRCAEMAGWSAGPLATDRGRGVALCHHGGRQLGVVCAEVSVDRGSGRIRVDGLHGTYDIGTIINRNTLEMGIRGAMLWGLGYALKEEVDLDGHRSRTSSFSVYSIPRFSDTPPIELDFLDNVAPGRPRGCGELPVIPTIGAIANAVYDAIGVRFYRLPMTPARVKKAWAEA